MSEPSRLKTLVHDVGSWLVLRVGSGARKTAFPLGITRGQAFFALPPLPPLHSQFATPSLLCRQGFASPLRALDGAVWRGTGSLRGWLRGAGKEGELGGATRVVPNLLFLIYLSFNLSIF